MYQKRIKKNKDRITGDIRILFETADEKEETEKEEHNERLIKDTIIRDSTLFEKEEDYQKPKRVSSFWSNNYIEYESNGYKNSNLSLDEYYNKVKPYLRDILMDLQSPDTWKIQLRIAINFISSKDTEEERVMHLTKGNIKFTPYIDANEVFNELIESLRSKHQNNLETSMRGSNFIFYSVQLMHYKCHKVNFKCGGSCIDSPNWIKSKKTIQKMKMINVFNRQQLLH